mgnify:CR=1 FL=1
MDTDHQLQVTDANRIPLQDAVKVSRGNRGDPPDTPWGRYLSQLAKGRNPEGAMKHSGISPTELALARSLTGNDNLEALARRSGVVGDTMLLARTLADANAARFLGVVDHLAHNAEREDVQLKAARTGLEVSRIIGGQSQAHGGVTVIQLGVSIHQRPPSQDAAPPA